MKQNKSKRSVWDGSLSVILLLALTLASCTKDPLPSGGEFKEGYANLTLNLVPPGAFSEISTRTLTDDQQNAINRAVVFIFKDGVVVEKVDAKIVNNSMTTSRINTSHNEDDKYDVVVIGNPRTDFDPGSYIGLTKAELQKSERMTTFYDGRWVRSEFPMWGEATGVLIHPISNTFQIRMLRALARVDLGVGAYNEQTGDWGGLDNFRLSEVTVKTITTVVNMIPLPETIDINGKAIAPSLSGSAMGVSTVGKYSKDDIQNDSYIKSTMFLAETKSTLAKPVKLIIGGSFNGGATTFYRVDMCLPDANNSGKYLDMNILRNHLYRMTITSVKGQGYTTSEEATTAPALNNIVVELNHIDEGGPGDIIFDGHSSITTDISEMIFYGKPNDVPQLTIATVKANFQTGVTTAKVSGVGLVPNPTILQNGVSTPIIVKINAEGTSIYTIEVGKLKKELRLVVQPSVDAHSDFIPFQNVASITIENPQKWITLSNNRTYVRSEQQQAYITGNNEGEAVFHFDENIATSGDPRKAQALVFRNNNKGTTRVVFEQRNLSGMVLGTLEAPRITKVTDNYLL